MTDADYCKGGECPQKNLCARYHDYLYRKEKGFDSRYPMTPVKDCPMFKLREFYGQ